jgi:hypothetical protein
MPGAMEPSSTAASSQTPPRQATPGQEVFKVGDSVTVTAELKSGNVDCTRVLPVGACGRVVDIDEDGDARVDFGDPGEHWVLKGNWHKLAKEDMANKGAFKREDEGQPGRRWLTQQALGANHLLREGSARSDGSASAGGQNIMREGSARSAGSQDGSTSGKSRASPRNKIQPRVDSRGTGVEYYV